MDLLSLFVLSLLPTVEPRYVLPLYVHVLGFSPIQAFVLSELAVLVLAVLLVLFLGVLDRLLEHTPLRPYWSAYKERTLRRVERAVRRYGGVAITLFVAVPLPLTGMWTGALAGFLLNVPKRQLLLYLVLGGTIANLLTLSLVVL